MKTQMEYARAGKITDKMKEAARQASISPENLRDNIARGTAIICPWHASGEEQQQRLPTPTGHVPCVGNFVLKIMDGRKRAVLHRKKSKKVGEHAKPGEVPMTDDVISL